MSADNLLSRLDKVKRTGQGKWSEGTHSPRQASGMGAAVRPPRKAKTPRREGRRAFSKSHCEINSTPPRRTIRNAIAGNAKSAIVRLAVMGYLPVSLAEWLIERGGMSGD